MYLSDLEVLVCLAEERNFSRVSFPQLSKESFLAHSSRTLSRKRLEYQLGQEGSN